MHTVSLTLFKGGYMAATQSIACGCNRTKRVRTADVKRGWGKYYSKACKARHCNPNKRDANKQNSNRLASAESRFYDNDDHCYINDAHPFSAEGVGQDGYNC